jgi:hypothetical protein
MMNETGKKITNMYTVEVYKSDRRLKKGERLFEKFDTEMLKLGALELALVTKYPKSEGFRFEIHETYVTRYSAMNGQAFLERYDTPYTCSASSETYWSS